MTIRKSTPKYRVIVDGSVMHEHISKSDAERYANDVRQDYKKRGKPEKASGVFVEPEQRLRLI